jgi:hypothetical protein
MYIILTRRGGLHATGHPTSKGPASNGCSRRTLYSNHEASEMDRIDVESEVHSSSTHEDCKTRTLYEMVAVWADQSWDGVKYKRIAEELWDLLDDLNLMEGPYGVSVTLLESCIVDSAEGIDAGLFQAEQAVGNLKKLLENEDFIEGARIIEVCVNTNPVCRISNVDQLLNKSQSIDYRKPQWWTRSFRSYWLFIGSVFFALMIVIYSLIINLGLRPLSDLILSITIGIPMFVGAYALRRSQSVNAFKWMWTLFGAFSIGFFMIFAPLILLLGHQLYMMLGVWFVWATLIPSMILGAFIGERWGRRRGYKPYF